MISWPYLTFVIGGWSSLLLNATCAWIGSIVPIVSVLLFIKSRQYSNGCCLLSAHVIYYGPAKRYYGPAKRSGRNLPAPLLLLQINPPIWRRLHVRLLDEHLTLADNCCLHFLRALQLRDVRANATNRIRLLSSVAEQKFCRDTEAISFF